MMMMMQGLSTIVTATEVGRERQVLGGVPARVPDGAADRFSAARV